ncbi:MAG: HAMP domain-containing histidine kinase [Methanospirillum sp.]|uniref:sensor histidine kinase n=1 Tax=Methanospirillum sp. TaxID=45200 RepID=UPI002372EB98|nr:HAMP domain-containing sensor histidine kinase [Methanospirillum sp.]MDD1728869.1 HAMP domain-containing histidine kinase [Methanospirillum sp.]
MSGETRSYCQYLIVHSKALALIIFILLAIVLEYVVHYVLQISIVYTHLFYPIIIIAAIWYQKKALWVALFFGSLHILVTYLGEGSISPDSVFRAIMLCVSAFLVGWVVQCMILFRDEEISQKHELEKTQASFQNANKKLNILSSITRHDILNQLTVLLGYHEIAEEMCTDPKFLEIMKKERDAAEIIQKQIEFTRHYQDIGIKAPVWHDINEVLQKIRTDLHNDSIALHSPTANLDLYADPLFPLICQNLVENSIRHGEHVTNIQVTYKLTDKDLILIYLDDGIGVPDNEKERIFERGYGKHTGMGLFLTQEILAITGLSIRETGVYGKGVRFEIRIPDGSFRIFDSLKE